MSKHLVSLVLVLALAGISSAATVQWNVASGDWSAGTNWNTGSLPGTGDFAAVYRSGNTSTINLTSGSVSVGRLKMQASSTTTLNITGGATLTNNGSVGSAQFYQNSGGTYGTMNLGDGTTSGTFIAYGGSASNYAIQTGGSQMTFNVESGSLLGAYKGTDHVGILGLGSTGGSNLGVGTINVKNNGTVDADSITFANTSQTVVLYGLGSAVYVYSGFSSSQIGTYYKSGDSQTVTYTTVTDAVSGSPLYGLSVTKIYQTPEPATVALLGLGGLLLRRKR